MNYLYSFNLDGLDLLDGRSGPSGTLRGGTFPCPYSLSRSVESFVFHLNDRRWKSSSSSKYQEMSRKKPRQSTSFPRGVLFLPSSRNSIGKVIRMSSDDHSDSKYPTTTFVLLLLWSWGPRLGYHRNCQRGSRFLSLLGHPLHHREGGILRCCGEPIWD